MKNRGLGKLNTPATLNRQDSDSIVASHLDFLASNGSFSHKISCVASEPAVCLLLLVTLALSMWSPGLAVLVP